MLTQAYKVSLCPTEIINIVIKTAYFISDHEIVKIKLTSRSHGDSDTVQASVKTLWVGRFP